MINADWINYWSARYKTGKDENVLNVVGPRVRERGCYDRSDLMAVGQWKSPRAKRRLESNTDDMICDITAVAFTSPLPIQHLVLTLLNGVKVPMASALLMVWRPEEHTVIDVRAVKSLVALGEIMDPAPSKYPPYMDYLLVCRAISERFSCDLRKLDRALYFAKGATSIA